MPQLSDYVEIAPAAAAAQWARVLARPPRPDVARYRQEDFLPVETLLCLAAMFVVNHRHFGGSTSGLAPAPVPQLAALFKRTPASILAKMANLDGSRPNGARHEVETAAVLLAEPAHLAAVYWTVLGAARMAAIGPDVLPNFLGLSEGEHMRLTGQEELKDVEVEAAVEPQLEKLGARMGGAATAVTERLLVAAARVGQHRFAREVLRNCEHRCVFCGLAPGHELEGRGLLVASHIKPWRDSVGRERLDVANGLAACPPHDAAFDAGLLWVNGGLRLHTSHPLHVANSRDPGMAAAFGRPPLVEALLMPQGSTPPGPAYLEWHRHNVAAA